VGAIRSAVVRHVEFSSLRRVAGEIGMSPSGLFSFIRSADRRAPQARTYQKLVAWFLRTSRAETPGPTTETAEASIEMLVEYLPPAKRPAAVREILNVLSSSGAGERPPKWMSELHARYRPRPRSKKRRQQRG
jgi:hypothetical protein